MAILLKMYKIHKTNTTHSLYFYALFWTFDVCLIYYTCSNDCVTF